MHPQDRFDELMNQADHTAADTLAQQQLASAAHVIERARWTRNHIELCIATEQFDAAAAGLDTLMTLELPDDPALHAYNNLVVFRYAEAIGEPDLATGSLDSALEWAALATHDPSILELVLAEAARHAVEEDADADEEDAAVEIIGLPATDSKGIKTERL